MQKEKMYLLRELAWTSLIAPHYDPKKLPKSKESFMPIDKVKKASKKGLERLREEQRKFMERNKLK